MSSAGPSTAKIAPQRLPAPSLFVGPRSRNASNTSLGSIPADPTSPTRSPLLRERSFVGDRSRADQADSNNADLPAHFSGVSAAKTSASNRLNASAPSQGPYGSDQRRPEYHDNERTDALWAEMQNTLDEVELNPLSDAPLFGPAHAKALEELRDAQIALAQAWARSDADEDAQTGQGRGGSKQDKASARAEASGGADRPDKSAEAARPPSETTTAGKGQDDDDIENELLLARKRREANDRYFDKVNSSVLEVVGKLEEVAKAMRAVERESKQIWDDSSSGPTDSIAEPKD